MTESSEPTVKKCFVISVIGDKGTPERKQSDQVLKHIVKAALGSNYEIERGDESDNPGAITPQIIESILEADLVVADLSGSNPNVFYELAVAHGYRKPTVHLLKEGDTPPFDVKDMRLIPYTMDPDDLEDARGLLKKLAERAEKSPEKATTPLSAAGRFIAFEKSGNPEADSTMEMVKSVDSLTTQVRRMLRQYPGGTRVLRADAVGPRANAKSARHIIERAMAEGRIEVEDFREVITAETTERFDDWARDEVAKLLDTSGSSAEVAEVVYSDDVMIATPDEDETS